VHERCDVQPASRSTYLPCPHHRQKRLIFGVQVFILSLLTITIGVLMGFVYTLSRDLKVGGRECMALLPPLHVTENRRL
jgi:hypothetical protein